MVHILIWCLLAQAWALVVGAESFPTNGARQVLPFSAGDYCQITVTDKDKGYGEWSSVSGDRVAEPLCTTHGSVDIYTIVRIATLNSTGTTFVPCKVTSNNEPSEEYANHTLYMVMDGNCTPLGSWIAGPGYPNGYDNDGTGTSWQLEANFFSNGLSWIIPYDYIGWLLGGDTFKTPHPKGAKFASAFQAWYGTTEYKPGQHCVSSMFWNIDDKGTDEEKRRYSYHWQQCAFPLDGSKPT